MIESMLAALTAGPARRVGVPEDDVRPTRRRAPWKALIQVSTFVDLIIQVPADRVLPPHDVHGPPGVVHAAAFDGPTATSGRSFYPGNGRLVPVPSGVFVSSGKSFDNLSS